MLIILSPAKSINLIAHDDRGLTKPEFVSKAWTLVKILKKYSVPDLRQFMKISENLAIENHSRYKNFKRTHSSANSHPAIFTFSGDVYRGIDSASLTPEDLVYAQDHLRILSGLYGVLRPLDIIQPYRLEMGSSLQNPEGKNLYAYWRATVAKSLNRQISALGCTYAVNLASDEYAKSVDMKKLKAKVINISFKEYKDNQLKFISTNAKRARGLMARYMFKTRTTDLGNLKGFNYEGYSFSAELSVENNLMFIR